MLIYTLELNFRTFVTSKDKNLTRIIQKDIEVTMAPEEIGPVSILKEKRSTALKIDIIRIIGLQHSLS